MNKINKFLLLAVIILAGSLIFVLFNDKQEDTEGNKEIIIPPTEETEEKPVGNYQFQDIENMGKAASIEDAFNSIFGKERLFTHEPTIKQGINYVNNFVIEINIEMDPKLDSRKEMIDFLHYLQYSELLSTNSIENLAAKNSKDTHFNLYLRVYQSHKPGMNLQKPIQKWTITSDKIEVMDFSDKESMLNEIHSYGNFEGYNPTKSN